MSPGAVSHPLHPGIFEAHPLLGASEEVSVLVLEAVGRGEDHDVGHVVHESRATVLAEAVSLANGPHEQVVATFVVDEAGVEERPVARDRTGFHDRPGPQPAHATRRLTCVRAIRQRCLPNPTRMTRVLSSA